MMWLLVTTLAMIGCGVLAEQKHRRVWLWILLGLFAGLISLLVLVCLPTIKNPSEYKTCSGCGESILTAAKVCKHCHTAQTV